MAPAVLAEVESLDERRAFVLCGERDPGLLAALARAGQIERAAQPAAAGPTRLVAHTADVDLFMAEMNAAWPGHAPRLDRPARRLAELLPPIRRWPHLLAPLPAFTPTMYELRRDDGQSFVPEPFTGRSGCYDVWPRDARPGLPGARPLYTLFYDAPTNRWLRGDWYGLRYLARVTDQQPRPARYHPYTGRMQLLAAARPPELYERVLTLASGRLPDWNDGWLEYAGIEPDLAILLAARLDLTLDMA